MDTNHLQNSRWLLPAGISELLPPQAEALESLRRKLLDLYRGWGYDLIYPPLLEYLDSLLTGTGNDLDLETFKLTDQVTGRQLGLRADITPQAARIDAHQLQRDVPVRLCYLGEVLRTKSSGYLNSRCPLQIGAELYGHQGVESDVEILALMVETLQLTQIENIHIDLGHVGIFRELSRQAALLPHQEAFLFDALQRKAIPEIQAYVASLSISEMQRQWFCDLSELNGDVQVLATASKLFFLASDPVRAALANITTIASQLANRYPNITLHFDLAELRGYGYHQGLVFAAFLPGHGQEIARGGRYDGIGKVFGRARPATGFSADLITLVALGKGSVMGTSKKGIFAPTAEDVEMQDLVKKLRLAGEIVIAALPGQTGLAADMDCDRHLVKVAEGWEVQPI